MNIRKYVGPRVFYASALALAIPVMLQAFVQTMVSLIDNFMVAGLGDIKMSGINVTNQLVFVLMVAFSTLSAAGGMFMSQFNGAKDREGMQQVFRFKIVMMSLLGLGITVLCTLLPEGILGLLLQGNSERVEIIAAGRTYIGIILFTFIPMGISMAIGSSLREIGKVRPPLVISIIATVVNTVLNWLFIYGNMGAPRLEVAGAAWATVAARTVEMLLFFAYITVKKPGFYVRLIALLKINLKLFVTILSKSGILFLSEMSWVLTETVMSAVFNGRGGAEVVSGMAAGWAIANIFFLVFGAIHTSIGVIVGGTLGRNDLETARIQARWLRTGGLVLGFIVSIGQFASVLLIPVVFGNLSAGARTITHQLLWVIALYMPIWTYLNAQFATARSGGDAIMGAWVDVGVNTTMFLPGIILLAAFTPLGPISMYAIVKVTDIVKVVIATWQLRKERWLVNLTTENGTNGGSL